MFVFNKMLFNKLVFCLFVSFLFVNVQWLYFNPGFKELDVFRYIENLDSGIVYNQIQYNFNGPLSYFLNEWLWIKIQIAMSNVGLSSNFIFFKIFPFINVFLITFFLTRRVKLYYIIFIFYPVFLFFFTSQIRLAFALAIILNIDLVRSKLLRLFLVIAACMIHTSMIMFLTVLYGLYIIYKSNFENYIKIFIVCFLSFIFVLVNSDFLSIVLNYLGSSRGDYYDDFSLKFSLFSTLFYLYLLFFVIFLILKGKTPASYFKYISIFALSAVFFCYFFSNSYPSRYLAVFFPFLIVAISECKSYFLFLSLLIFMVYGLYFDLNIPGILKYIF